MNYLKKLDSKDVSGILFEVCHQYVCIHIEIKEAQLIKL